MDIFKTEKVDKNFDEACCDYRYKETYFRRSNGAIVKQIELVPLKSTGGFDWLAEEFSNGGAECAFPIIGEKVKSGDRVQIRTINETRSWDSMGCDDSYDLIAVKSSEPQYPTVKKNEN